MDGKVVDEIVDKFSAVDIDRIHFLRGAVSDRLKRAEKKRRFHERVSDFREHRAIVAPRWRFDRE